MELERLLKEEKIASDAADEVCKGVKLHIAVFVCNCKMLIVADKVCTRERERSVCSVWMKYGSCEGRRFMRSSERSGVPYSSGYRPTARDAYSTVDAYRLAGFRCCGEACVPW